MRKTLEQKISLIMLCLNEKPTVELVERTVQGATESLQKTVEEQVRDLRRFADRKADAELMHEEMSSIKLKLQEKADASQIEDAVRGMHESVISQHSTVEADQAEDVPKVSDEELERIVAPVHKKMTADLIQKSTASITESLQQKMSEQLDSLRRSLEEKADSKQIDDQMGGLRAALQRKVDGAELDSRIRGIADRVGDLTDGLKDSLALTSAESNLVGDGQWRPAQQAFPWEAYPMSVDG